MITAQPITGQPITGHPGGEAWHSQAADEVLKHFGSSATGLAAQEAAQRLASDGPNELKEGRRISPLQIFLGQFMSLMVWILIAAGVISGVLGELVDAIAILAILAIFAILVLNAMIGFYQECSAEKSIAALRLLTAPQAKVRRDGKVASIAASEIVAGDILILEAGDLVSADARILPLSIHLLWINLVTDGLPALCLATDRIDPDVMKRRPRHRAENITDRAFLRTMFCTGLLTAGVAFAVYYYILRTETTATARSYAFAVLVFAELLRSFGARSESKPVWRISLLTNVNLVIVVAISFGLQVWSQHNATLGHFLKTSTMSLTDCFLLLAVGAIPLLVLELAKVVRHARRLTPL